MRSPEKTLPGRRVRKSHFRIGVHVGDVIVQGENLFGDGVNIAARLEALAEPGGICISGMVRDQIGTKLPIAFTDLGEQQVKNIAQPIRVYRVAAGEDASRPQRGHSPRPCRTSRRSRCCLSPT